MRQVAFVTILERVIFLLFNLRVVYIDFYFLRLLELLRRYGFHFVGNKLRPGDTPGRGCVSFFGNDA